VEDITHTKDLPVDFKMTLEELKEGDASHWDKEKELLNEVCKLPKSSTFIWRINSVRRPLA